MKICKQIMSTVLVLAMVLSMVGVMTVSAEDGDFVLNVTEQVVDADAGVSKLVFAVEVPAGTYAGMDVIFSYDTKAVQPVNATSFENATAVEATKINAAMTPLATATTTVGDRIGVWAAGYNMGTNVEAGEFVLAEFYFKPIEGATFKKDTFKLETEYVKDETVLGKFFTSTNGAVSVSIHNLEGDEFTYGSVTETDTIALGTFEHSGTKVRIGFNLAPFTADTRFVSMDKANLYAGTMDATKWGSLSANNFNVYKKMKITGVNNDASGPFQVFTPTFGGDYKVYALKYGHATSKKDARVDVNGTTLSFEETGNSTKTNGLSNWCTYWSKAAGEPTVTLTAGKPVVIMDTTINVGSYDEGAVFALAFVPADQAADVALSDENRVIADIMQNAPIEQFMAEDFASEKVQDYTIKLKDSTVAPATEAVDFTVKPLYRRSQFLGSTAWPYDSKSIVGHPTRYATVEDFIDKYLMDKGNAFDDIKTVSQTDTYQVYVNGIREYRTDVKLLMPGDEVEIKKEAVTSANFKPFDIGANEAYNKLIYRLNGTNLVRFGLKASVINKNTYPHLYNGLDVVKAGDIVDGVENTNGKSDRDEKGTYPTDTFFAGSMTIVKEGDYQGQKIYFPLVGMSSTNNDVSGDAAMFLPNIPVHSGHDTGFTTEAYKGIKTITVETPEGEKTVAEPYGLTTGTSGSWYNANGLFWVNSTTTNDVRFEKIDDEYVIRTDGFALIRVITKKADGSTETARAELTPGKSYSFKPESGDTVYVWKDTPYGGYSTIPLFAPFVGE